MTNFIFKSQGTYNKISNSLEIIQTELRHQRSDNIMILRLLNKLVITDHLQKQVDDFYDDSESWHPEETKVKD